MINAHSQSIALHSSGTFVTAITGAPENDTSSTDEILVTANRLKMSTLLSPNKVQVLNTKLISMLNGDKLSDVLSFADAVFIKDYGFNSGLKILSVNSTQSEHALILLNGLKLNNPQNAQFDTGLLQVTDISSVEISKGGASSLYGSEAIGGVINILTNEKLNERPFYFNASNTTGSYKFNKFSISTGGSIKLHGIKRIYLSSSYSNEQAKNNYLYNFFNGFTNEIRERINNDYRASTFNINSNIVIDRSSTLTLYSLYSKWDRGVPGTDFGYMVSQARQIDDNVISSLVFKKVFSNNLEFKTITGYKYYFQRYFDPLTYITSSPINSFYKINTFVNSSEFNISGKGRFALTSGYEINYNSILSNEIEKSNQTQLGIYTAGKMEINNVFDKIIIYPSARFDFYSNIGRNVVTGKVGINIKPFKKENFSIKSSIANNFRVPTFNELYWIGLGNKNLLPEKSISYDGGFYYDFILLAENRLEASYFNINTVDRILWKPDNSGIWRPENIGRTKSEGIDLSLRTTIKFSKLISSVFSFNYNYARAIKESEDYPGDPTFGKQLIYVPQEFEKAFLSLAYSVPSDLLKLISINLFYTFTGKRYSDFENTAFSPYYDLIDANINVSLSLFKTETSFKLSVNNITNKNYDVIRGYPMPLRNFKFQLAIKY